MDVFFLNSMKEIDWFRKEICTLLRKEMSNPEDRSFQNVSIVTFK